ncbi:hypothetical protein JSY14_01670 [Brachybacterium sp. EF45031]|uniref:hypothetical protein n=1 Tax=Brachybacterium sillae TaxID=2810536 RepID=UPI00217CF922|nr:hypothetical protein [Brachybacterium sillae]MCS6710791.1 hypothetical protein [Brachybacterium sillae]
MKKVILFIGLAVGFVLGSKMGREPYEKIESAVRGVAEDPTVRAKADEAKQKATQLAQDAAATAKEKAPGVADQVKATVAQGTSAVKDKVSGGSSDTSTGADLPTGDVDGVAGGDAQVGDKPLGA